MRRASGIPNGGAKDAGPMNGGILNGPGQNEPAANNGNGNGGQTIIGIDFGTTFTSCSFTFVRDDLSAPGRPDIYSVTSWKSFPGKNQSNIPSKLFYMIDNKTKAFVPMNKQRQADWGLRALSADKRDKLRTEYPNLSLQEFEWFKLHLKTDFSNMDAEHRRDFERERKLKSLPPNMTALEAATDFLRCVITDIEAYLDLALSERDRNEVQFVLTIPSIWSQAERDLTRRAAVDAGFLRNGGNLTLIKEPEAAAFAAIYKHTTETPDKIYPGDGFIVCDAGGGTVDLVGYRVEKFNPLRISEATESTGGFCGSSFLNNKFDQLLRTRYREVLSFPKLADVVMNEFDTEIKKNLGAHSIDKSEEWSIELPDSVQYQSAYQRAGIRPDFPLIKVTTGDLLEHVFDPVLNEISALVHDQIEDLSSKLSVDKVKYVYLVGGFGENLYLQRRLQEDFAEYRKKKQFAPQLKCLTESQQMVTKGAVFYGCSSIVVESKLSPAAYGITYNERVQRPFPPGRKVILTLTGTHLAKDSFHWALKKGQTYTEDSPITFDRVFSFAFHKDHPEFDNWQWEREITLYTFLGNNPPSWKGQEGDASNEFCVLTVTSEQCSKSNLVPAPEGPGSEGKFLIRFTMSLVFHGALLRYTIVPAGGEEISVKEVNYSNATGLEYYE